MAPRKQLIKSPKKVVKDAKPTEIEPKVEVNEEYKCTCCGHKFKRQETNFGRSKSPIYKGNNGYLSICRNCVAELYEQYVKFYDGDENAAAERICQITDMYFDETLWASSRKISESRNGKSRNRISTYISRLNLAFTGGATTYSDTLVKRWADEDMEAEAVAAEAEEESESKEEPQVDPKEEEAVLPVSDDVVRRFGGGFEPDDYESMQYEYDDWVERYGDPIDKRQEELYVSICFMKQNLRKLLQKGDSNIGAAANSYRAQIDAATTEIEDRKRKAEAEKQLTPVGEMIRDIEEFCPAEYYKDKKLFVDFDSLKEYIERFMFRPLRNLLTGSKELDKEFSLSDSED